MTEAKDLSHLNTEAKRHLVNALDIKHRRQDCVSASGKLNKNLIEALLPKVDEVVENLVQTLAPYLQLTFSHLKIERGCIDQLDLDSTPQTGGFGEVYRARWLKSGDIDAAVDVGIKFPKRYSLSNSLIHEIEIIAKFRHDNIVRFYGIVEWIETDRIGMVMEWCDSNLSIVQASRILSTQPSTNPRTVSKTNYFLYEHVQAVRSVDPLHVVRKVAAALEYMHVHWGVVHRY